MKKRKLSVMFLSMLLCIMIMAGCSKEKGEDTSGKEQDTTEATPTVTEGAEEEEKNEEPQETMYKVTFLDTDGTTELSSVEVKEGETVSEYVAEKENQVFMGWFGTPSLTHEFDFSAPITADTQVFAGFLEDKEDTRSFAILGSGTSPLLSISSWGAVINEEHYLVKEEGANVYTITLDLYEGDEFQFAINTSWHNQRGAGYFETTSLDGVEYFINSGGAYATDTRKSNMKCGKTGNYTLTLTTYPGADIYDTENEYYTEENKEGFNLNPYDKIIWVYNGDIKEPQAELQTSYYIKGAVITGWADLYEDQYKFVEENGVHTLIIDLEEGDEFLFTSLVQSGDTSSVGNEYVRYSNITEEASLTYVDGTESFNILAKAAGTYTFTYNPETSDLTVGFEAK